MLKKNLIAELVLRICENRFKIREFFVMSEKLYSRSFFGVFYVKTCIILSNLYLQKRDFMV